MSSSRVRYDAFIPSFVFAQILFCFTILLYLCSFIRFLLLILVCRFPLEFLNVFACQIEENLCLYVELCSFHFLPMTHNLQTISLQSLEHTVIHVLQFLW